MQAAMENNPAVVGTDSPPINGLDFCLQTNTTNVNVNGNYPAQQR